MPIVFAVVLSSTMFRVISFSVNSPLHAVVAATPWETAMVGKQDFTPDEWVKILQSTMLAGWAVYAAEPSGLWGVLKEAYASSSAIASAKSDAGSTDLMRTVAEQLGTKEGRTAVQEAMRDFEGAKPSETVQRCLATLQEVSNILDTKAPQEAASFKAWLLSISQRAAEASSEGGFLGIGSVKVTEAERAAIADISKVLGTSA